MPRVLFIASKPFLACRGPSIRVSQNLLALAQLGYEVDFLTVPVGAPDPIPGVRMLRVPNLLLARSLPEGRSLRTGFFDLLLLATGATLAWRRRYAVVHGFDDAGVVAWLVGRASGACVIFETPEETCRAPRDLWRRLVTGLCARLERGVLRHVDAVIGAGSESLPAEAVSRGRTCVIPNIPSALEAPQKAEVVAWRERLTRDVDDLLVTGVGSFAGACDLERLLEAVPPVRAEDQRVRFVVVGGTALEIRRRQRDLARRGLADSVQLVGRVTPTDLSAILAASDILAAPRTDGAHAPMKVLDYLQSGTAIVATDRPANRDVLTPDVAELTLPTPDAFADGILALCRNPARRYELGQRGREMIAQTHRFEPFRDSLRCCYDYVTARREE